MAEKVGWKREKCSGENAKEKVYVCIIHPTKTKLNKLWWMVLVGQKTKFGPMSMLFVFSFYIHTYVCIEM